MLVLTRKLMEEIVIDNGRVRVQVVGIRGGKVRIGIHADSEIPVHRGELCASLQGGALPPTWSPSPGTSQPGGGI